MSLQIEGPVIIAVCLLGLVAHAIYKQGYFLLRAKDGESELEIEASPESPDR